MRKLKITIADEEGTVLDSLTVELEDRAIEDTRLLWRAVLWPMQDDINWQRISKMLLEK